MLSDASLKRILERLPDLTIGVLGDLFLDRYLEIDAALTEPSLETGLDAYQVVLTLAERFDEQAGAIECGKWHDATHGAEFARIRRNKRTEFWRIRLRKKAHPASGRASDM